MLVDARYRGRPENCWWKRIATDSSTFWIARPAKFSQATPFVKKLNWAKGIDSHGKPIRTGVQPTEEGSLVCPDMTGATNWFSPSYNPATRLLYFMALENCHLYFLKPQEFEEGKAFYATGVKRLPGETGQKILLAYNPETELVCLALPASGHRRRVGRHHDDRRRPGIFRERCGWVRGGGCPDGKSVWHFNTGQPMHASPMSYAVNGTQYVAIAAGSDVFSFGLE